MRLFLCSLVALAFFTVAALPAQAQVSRLYFAGYLGLTKFRGIEYSESTNSTSGELELDNGTSLAGALGLRLTRHFRIEGEFHNAKSDLSKIDFAGGGSTASGGELTTWAGLVSLYYDFDVDWSLQPFVSAGVGAVNYEVEVTPAATAANVSDDATTYVWTVGGGVKYRTSPDFAFTGGYRYMASPDLQPGSYDIDYNNHEFRIGIEYDLPVD
ncbi:MAG: porin family protein [Alphaproteobacteria bacterium]|nr:porin family protein [Alphaproteobacteria bacterium]